MADDAALTIRVEVDDRQRFHDVDVDARARLLAAALHDCDVSAPAEVGLAFVEIDEMARLNADHMGETGPTDVLAFPIDGAGSAPPGQPALVGDIVICPEYASRADQPLDDELALLVVHGALHLVGHDHAEPDEAARMHALEAALLSRHHVAVPPGG